jgi:hypothetical protein
LDDTEVDVLDEALAARLPDNDVNKLAKVSLICHGVEDGA